MHDVRVVLIAYVDETGDTGDVAKSGSSSCYGLGCLLMELDSWGASFESTLELRRRLKQSHGLPFRTEVKANYLIRGGGPIRALNLAPNHRSIIYRAHLRHVAQLRARAFAVVVDKRSARMQSDGFFFTAWQALMNRLERTQVPRNDSPSLSSTMRVKTLRSVEKSGRRGGFLPPERPMAAVTSYSH